MAEIKYEIVERIAVLGERPRGWERQLNLISWNEGEPKYDIRDWSPDGTRMGKGISLSHDELAILKGILEDMELWAGATAQSFWRSGSEMSPVRAAKSCWTGWTKRRIFSPHRLLLASTEPVRAGCACTA